jgi:isopentenyl-diphosphate Delta-isomerase
MTDVILVDEHDRQTGIAEKIKAHSDGGIRHRAISIFIFNKDGELMMQQRAGEKYHAKSQWANTCDGHPLPGEEVIDCAHRKLKQEMGFDCEMQDVFSFKYQTPAGSGLFENELDHIIFGRYDGTPSVNPDEASDWKWVRMEALGDWIRKDPESYVPWLRMMFDDVMKRYRKYMKNAES